MRVFAGPNGSGKSTLVKEIQSKYDLGYFVNADHIESMLIEYGYFDLSEVGVELTKAELKRSPSDHSIVKKADIEGLSFNLELLGKRIIPSADNMSS